MIWDVKSCIVELSRIVESSDVWLWFNDDVWLWFDDYDLMMMFDYEVAYDDWLWSCLW
jgi:hypothetical protein